MKISDANRQICPNCEKGFDSEFDFCPYCGQQNKAQKIRLKYFLGELVSGIFNLDSKIFRTLHLLVFKPTELPLAFLQGKRTFYIPPVRLYLVVSLVYFTFLSFKGSNFVQFSNEGGQETVQADSVQPAATGTLKTITGIEQSGFKNLEKLKTEAGKTGLQVPNSKIYLHGNVPAHTLDCPDFFHFVLQG